MHKAQYQIHKIYISLENLLVHGSPLGEEEIQLVRKKLNWGHQPFSIPSSILEAWRNIGKKGLQEEERWKKKNKLKNNSLSHLKKLSSIITKAKKNAAQNDKPIATRKSSEDILTLLTNGIPELVGGSADLAGSNNTKTKNSKVISAKDFDGNYIHYGIREHGMAAAMNGLALYGGIIPYGGTFLIFSDYCKPSIRLSALMGLKVIYIFSHDSIGLGEDGPTHQPIEQLAGLRAIPNLNAFRPADINETLECWQIALKSKKTPSAIVLSRQKLPYVNPSFTKENKCELGAYVVNATSQNNKITLIASGSEVEIALEAQKKLKESNLDSTVVSMPCQELFDQQNNQFKNDIIQKDIPVITIEAGSVMGWEKYSKNNMGINSFGESGPYKEVYKHFDLTSDKIVALTKKLVR